MFDLLPFDGGGVEKELFIVCTGGVFPHYILIYIYTYIVFILLG